MSETTTTAAAPVAEAIRLAAWLNEGCWHQMRLGDVEAAGRELRRLHAENAGLRAALEAAATQLPTTEDPDGKAFRTAARLGLTLRMHGGCAQSSIPGTPCAYEVAGGQDPAAAMREAIGRAEAVIANGGESQRLQAQPERPHIDANALEAMARERPNDMFLKGSGVLKLTGAIRQLEAKVRALHAEAPRPLWPVDQIASDVCQTVAELGDRNSPEGQPAMMLVTAEELFDIVKEAVSAATQQPQEVPHV